MLHRLLLSSILASAVSGQTPNTTTSIRVDGGSFVDASCNEYFISGVNGWLVAETGGAQYFNMMEATGLKVLRFFAHGSDPSWIIQPRPGVYDETKLRAIDAVIADAASRGLRVTISLANNWKTPDGKKQYVSWVPELHCDVARCAGSPNDDAQFECEKQACPDEDKFFSDPRVRTLYKNHIRYMLTRRNTVTGRIYGSDPTILSINLMNEPNVKSTPACWGNNDITAGQPCVDILQAWIQEMSEFAKSVAPTALITIGYEGFYGPRSSPAQLAANPRPPYSRPIDALYFASQAGQDFVPNNALPSIDFAAVHLWPDNWLVPRVDFVQTYIAQHAADAARLGKPLVIEEFGKEANATRIATERDPFFKAVYDAVAASLASGGSLKGAEFWEYGGNDTRSVTQADSTWPLITADSRLIASYNAGGVHASLAPTCAPGKVRSYEQITSGSARFVCYGPNLIVNTTSVTTLRGPPATTEATCARACVATPTCNGFTLSQGTCTLQRYAGSSFPPAWKSGAKSCLGVSAAVVNALGLMSETPEVTASNARAAP